MEERNHRAAGPTLDIIDLVNDDGDESSDSCNRGKSSRSPPPAAKRSRQEEDQKETSKNANKASKGQDTSNVPNHAQCPIKIFATYKDEQTRHGKPPSHWSYLHCWTLRELLGLDHNPNDPAETESIDFLIISNFMIDLEYFIEEEAPELLSVPTTLVVYHHLSGDKRQSDLWKQMSAGQVHFLRRDPNERSDAIANPIPFGCHHTKLFLVGYTSGRLRVIVHTCNLLQNDIHHKCQGAYIQDFYLKDSIFSCSPFETALMDYLATYRYLQKHKWRPSDPQPSFLLDQIGNYDFSTATVVLIPSTPGFHKGTKGSACGYLAVRKAIQGHVAPSSARGSSIVCQFSSIGSLSESYLQTLWNAWDINRVLKSGLQPERSHQFQLVYPTFNEIAATVEGIRGGASVPGSARNVSKPFLQALWHRWTSSNAILEKGRHVPHIKTYYQVDEVGVGMHWFMIGSHNLSKAAWGELQNGIRGPCFKIFHWELGVFVSAKTLGVDRLVPLGGAHHAWENEQNVCEIPLPYAFRPDRHGPNDRAWTTDMMNE